MSLLTVSVDDSCLTVVEESELAVEIILHVRVFFRSDMILIEVGERSRTILDAVDSVEL